MQSVPVGSNAVHEHRRSQHVEERYMHEVCAATYTWRFQRWLQPAAVLRRLSCSTFDPVVYSS
jgi:hypothetical protein